MNDKIIGAVMIPDRFAIRGKADAKRFLEELVCKGSEIVIRDLNDPAMVYIIDRTIGDKGITRVAHERKGKSVFEPDFMYDGEKAIDLVYRGRKTFNAKWFSAEARKEE